MAHMNLEEAVEELGKLAFTSCQHERYAQRCLYCADTVVARRRSLLSRLVASVEEETLERAASAATAYSEQAQKEARIVGVSKEWRLEAMSEADAADEIAVLIRALKSQP